MKTLIIDSSLSETSLTRKTLSLCLDYLKREGLHEMSFLRLDDLHHEIKPLTKERLQKRKELLAKKEYENEIFKFANILKDADKILIASPFYDLSVPALLKCFIEMTMVDGLTFKDEGDHAKGLLKAKELLFLYVSGYEICESNPDFASPYIEGIAKMWGVREYDSFHLDWNKANSLKEVPFELKEKLKHFME